MEESVLDSTNKEHPRTNERAAARSRNVASEEALDSGEAQRASFNGQRRSDSEEHLQGSAGGEFSSSFNLGVEMAGSGLPKFELPNIEIPAAFREFADTVALLANEGFGVVSDDDAIPNPATPEPEPDVAEDPTDGDDDELEAANDEPEAIADPRERSDSAFANTAGGTTEYSLLIADAVCVNANAMVEFASKLLRAKSLSEIVELSTAHARRHIETVTEQTKQLAGVTEKMARQKAKAAEREQAQDETTEK
jgi:hypothetical protein